MQCILFYLPNCLFFLAASWAFLALPLKGFFGILTSEKKYIYLLQDFWYNSMVLNDLREIEICFIIMFLVAHLSTFVIISGTRAQSKIVFGQSYF